MLCCSGPGPGLRGVLRHRSDGGGRCLFAGGPAAPGHPSKVSRLMLARPTGSSADVVMPGRLRWVWLPSISPFKPRQQATKYVCGHERCGNGYDLLSLVD